MVPQPTASTSMAIKMSLTFILSPSVTAQQYYFTFKCKGEGLH